MTFHNLQSGSSAVATRAAHLPVWLWWGAVVAYFLLLSYLLLTPHPLWFMGTAGAAAEETVDSTLADYAQHALAYAVLGGLITLATVGKTFRLRCGWLTAAAAHGVLCEILQHFIPHRHFGAHDALANAVGVMGGWAIAMLLCRLPVVRAVTPSVCIPDPDIIRD
ncbi:VanZ like family protein [Symmachiella macrocystis]|uniref:VanZ like family protein n=1 Tax=Symmachiella macrocystis TaxID=2527985 RepID=A0A5C6BKW5_9PLAN|nr:VanZ family protein [Symmachiella macrocystis]TWU12615.1 VanZ like family protein [Symmachiella macrocystis]